MVEVALLFQVAHRVADGRRRDAQPEFVGKTPRTGWLSRFDVRLDYSFENTTFALVETWGSHDLNIAMTRVWTYGRAQRPRSLRGQIGRNTVQPEPAGWGKSNPRARERLVDDGPSSAFPCMYPSPFLIGDLESLTCAKPEVHLFGRSVLGGQRLLAAHHRFVRGETANPFRVGRNVPASACAIERMRRWSNAQIRRAGPISGIVPRRHPATSEIRHLVVLVSGPRHPRVRAEKLLLVILIGPLNDRATISPSRDGSLRFDGQAVE